MTTLQAVWNPRVFQSDTSFNHSDSQCSKLCKLLPDRLENEVITFPHTIIWINFNDSSPNNCCNSNNCLPHVSITNTDFHQQSRSRYQIHDSCQFCNKNYNKIDNNLYTQTSYQTYRWTNYCIIRTDLYNILNICISVCIFILSPVNRSQEMGKKLDAFHCIALICNYCFFVVNKIFICNKTHYITNLTIKYKTCTQY